ncbi:hypothetical protein [Scytonema sp. PCC 10023]
MTPTGAFQLVALSSTIKHLFLARGSVVYLTSLDNIDEENITPGMGGQNV